MCVCVCVIMKTMCLPGYHRNGFVATHALGHTWAQLASVRFEHSVCRGSLMSTYIYIYLQHRTWFGIPSSNFDILSNFFFGGSILTHQN